MMQKQRQQTLQSSMRAYLIPKHSYSGLNLEQCLEANKRQDELIKSYSAHWINPTKVNADNYTAARIAYFRYIGKCPVCRNNVKDVVCHLY